MDTGVPIFVEVLMANKKTIWKGGGTPTLPQRPGDVVTKTPIYPKKSPSNK